MRRTKETIGIPETQEASRGNSESERNDPHLRSINNTAGPLTDLGRMEGCQTSR